MGSQRPTKDSSQSHHQLASIHWLMYKPTVFGGGWFMSLVVGVCVLYYRRSQPVRQAACGL